MKPIGLTGKQDGEVMIIHLCLQCGKISCNRIAGDDNSYVITQLLEKADTLSQDIAERLVKCGITCFTQKDKEIIFISLYGYDYKRYIEPTL